MLFYLINYSFSGNVKCTTSSTTKNIKTTTTITTTTSTADAEDEYFVMVIFTTLLVTCSFNHQYVKILKNSGIIITDRLCDLVVRVPGYRSFPALPDFLRSSGSGTGSAQLREYN
jgi:hypothetical protein